ncbi:MAG: hypothetical protein AVDCRST_MAG77-5698, partial [uncultured Chloroflexi bacterium]
GAGRLARPWPRGSAATGAARPATGTWTTGRGAAQDQRQEALAVAGGGPGRAGARHPCAGSPQL